MRFFPVISWFKSQNWFEHSFAFVGILNMVIAGARVMGWIQLADFCGKLEDAIQAMVNTWLTRRQQDKAKLLMLIVLCFSFVGCAFARTMDVQIKGNNIKSPYANGDADINYRSHTELRIWK